jgi:hypothetical protein
MGVTVTFSYAAWLGSFPQFKHVLQPQAQGYFNLATSWCRNDGGGPVDDATLQISLLNLLTAHLAQLFAPPPEGGPATPIPGRISSASEGSVSVGTDLEGQMPSRAWFAQTEFGLTYWQLSAPFRTMRYLPKRHRRIFNPWRGHF